MICKMCHRNNECSMIVCEEEDSEKKVDSGNGGFTLVGYNEGMSIPEESIQEMISRMEKNNREINIKLNGENFDIKRFNNGR